MFFIGKIIDIIGDLFVEMYVWFIAPFINLLKLETLIFGQDDDGLIYLTFQFDEFEQGIVQGMNIMMIVAMFILVIGIIYGGARIAGAAINPASRSVLLDFVKDLVLVTILLFNLPFIYSMIFELNIAFIGLFEGALAGDFAFELHDDESSEMRDQGILGWIFIQLILLGLGIWANFYYIMRKLTLMILMILGPLMIMFYLLPHTKKITGAWFKEFIGTVFVQSIHAVVFWLLFIITSSSGGPIETVILYAIFIPVGESIRSLLGMGGDMTNNLNKAGAMMGMAGMAGVFGSVKGALGGQSVTGALKGAYDGVKQRREEKKNGAEGNQTTHGSTVGSGTGTNTGTTSRSERMLKAGEISSKAGKAVLGSAGSIAGMGLGPVGSIVGATAGTAIGGATGGLAGRAGTASAQGIKNRMNKGKMASESAKKQHSKEGIADSMADDNLQKWEGANKDSIKKDLKGKFPDASNSQIDGLYNDRKNSQRNQFKKSALSTLNNAEKGNGQTVKGDELKKQAVDNATNNWARENRESYAQKQKTENPNITNNEIDQGFNKEVNKQRKKYQQSANKALPKEQEGPFVSKADFTKNFGNELYNQEKQDFKSKINKNGSPNMSEDEIDVAFQKQHGNRKKVLAEKSQGATSNINGARLFTKQGSVNKDYLANQMANDMTNGQREQFVKTVKKENGLSGDQASQVWNDKHASTAHKSNLSNAKSQVSQMEIPNKISMDKGGTMVSAKAYMKEASGYNTVSKASNAFNTKVNESIVQSVSDQPESPTQAKITGGVKGVAQGSKEAAKTMFTNQDASPIEKQSNYRSGVAYATGVIGGVSGYQKGAAISNKINPYNKEANQQISEVRKIEQMAQKKTSEDGGSYIPSGAVQQVITPNSSYIQVKDTTGQTQVVSRKGSGDSSLKQGEEIYQDLNVQEGSLVPNTPRGQQSSFYQKDTSGGKVIVNRELQNDANQLLTKRATPSQPKMEYAPVNQKVDSGQFYADDIKNHTQNGSQNVKMIVERDRSYIISTDTQSGKEQRFSPYGKGDTSIPQGQQRTRECSVINKRLHIIDQEDKNQEKIDPNELIPKKPNHRVARRNNLEKSRRHSMGGINE